MMAETEQLQPVPGELRVVTITAILEHGRTLSISDVSLRAQTMGDSGVRIYHERSRETSARKFSQHVSLLVSLPGRKKPINTKVFERKVQATGLKSDEEIAQLQIALMSVLGFDARDPVAWTVKTPLRNGFFFLPHPESDSKNQRAAVHDMMSLCMFTRDSFKRSDERATLISFDPQVVRGIKICIPSLGTIMISSTGNVSKGARMQTLKLTPQTTGVDLGSKDIDGHAKA